MSFCVQLLCLPDIKDDVSDVLDIIVDSCYWIDICLNFVTGYTHTNGLVVELQVRGNPA